MKIILDIIHDYGHAFKLDFDKFPLDGLSTNELKTDILQ